MAQIEIGGHHYMVSEEYLSFMEKTLQEAGITKPEPIIISRQYEEPLPTERPWKPKDCKKGHTYIDNKCKCGRTI